MTISCVLSGGSSVSVILEESVNWSFDPKACLSSLSDKKQRRRIVSELKCRMNSLYSKVGITDDCIGDCPHPQYVMGRGNGISQVNSVITG